MAEFPQPPSSVQEQLHDLHLRLAYERTRCMELEATLAQRAPPTESKALSKTNKISRKAFSCKDYDGAKDARTILAWVSQLDDYFHGEDFTERDMVKCAANHLTGRAALWWNATKQGGHRPRTWHAFQRAFKRQF